MVLHAAFLLLGMSLLWGSSAEARPSGSAAMALSALAGPVLGAAAECRGIADERVDGAADAALDAIERLSRDRGDFAAANELLQQGLAAGGRAIERGATDCARTAEVLGAMEKRLARPVLGESRPAFHDNGV